MTTTPQTHAPIHRPLIGHQSTRWPTRKAAQELVDFLTVDEERHEAEADRWIYRVEIDTIPIQRHYPPQFIITAHEVNGYLIGRL